MNAIRLVAFLAASTVLTFSLTADAAQRAYIRPQPGVGEFNNNSRVPDLTPSVRLDDGGASGHGAWLLEDDSAGTVTMTDFQFGNSTTTTFNTTGFMMASPGSYFYLRVLNTEAIPGGQTGPGSSAALSQIDWGVLTGFTQTGTDFCRSTPPFVCTFIGRPEDGSVAPVLFSTTYDIGTWTFNATNDFEGTPYIAATLNGGVSNNRIALRGNFAGSSLPALPLLGFGALAVALGIGGVGALRRRRN